MMLYSKNIICNVSEPNTKCEKDENEVCPQVDTMDTFLKTVHIMCVPIV